MAEERLTQLRAAQRSIQKQTDRLFLKRKMLENSAINDGPILFDSWADKVDEVNEQITKLGLEALHVRMKLADEERLYFEQERQRKESCSPRGGNV